MRWILLLALAMAANAAPKLTIDRLVLQQYEDGPVLGSSYEFLPGETIFVGAKLSGFDAEKKEDEMRHVHLSFEAQFVDAANVPVEKPKFGVIDETLRPQDKEWFPKFQTSFLIPSFALAGTYRIPFKAKDEVGNTEASQELEFRVRGPVLEPSDTLLTRNFHFYRNENDTMPLNPAIYAQGTVLWARFDIVGYKFGPNNRFAVDYGIAILGTDGKELFAQPEAAEESKESFYPQRRVPGGINLNMGTAPKGTYTLVLSVKDKVGGQTWEQRESFSIE